VLGASGAAFQIRDLDRAAGSVAQAVDGQSLAALDLQAGLEREQDEERHDVGGGQMMEAVQVLAELGAGHRPPPTCGIELHPGRIV
jgi:hypothetical protein